MTNKIKTIGLISFLAALLSIIILSAGLSNLELQSGFQFQGGSQPNLPNQSFAEIIPEGSLLIFIATGILALTSLALFIYVIIRLSVYINLKSVAITFLVLLILLGIIYLVPETNQAQTAIRLIENSSVEITPLPPIYRESTGELPDILYWILITVTVLGLGYIAIRLIRDWKSNPKPETELTQNAQQALNNLKSGMDFRNVILRCYFQMTTTLQKEQGVERQDSMTVREFENALEIIGYPAKPVHQLTALFENIRYGEKETTIADEKAARESLGAIIQFAQQKSENR